MTKKLLYKILGGFLGLIVGTIGGGYLGLILGGSFLGSFDIYAKTGLEGYEIAAYIGAIIGAVVMTVMGMKISLKKFEQRNP